MSFKFKLEKLLTIKKRNRDKVLSKWTIEQGKLQILMNDKKEMLNQLSQNKLRYSQAAAEGKIQEVKILQLYIASFKFKFVDINKKISQQEEVIIKIKSDLFETSKDFKVMERLKEKRKDEYLSVIKKQEEKFLDEINTLKVKRGKDIGSI